MSAPGWLATRRVVVVDGGTGQPSVTHALAERTTAQVAAALRARVPAVVTVERILARHHVADLATSVLTGTMPPGLADVVDLVGRADAVVLVVGPTALLATLLAAIDHTLDGVPVLVAGASSSGPAAQVRALGGVVVPSPEALADGVVRRGGPATVSLEPVPEPVAMVDGNWEDALRHGELGEWSEAARLLDGVVEDDPDTAAPRLLLVEALMSSAQWRPAAAHLRRLLAEHPADEYARFLFDRCTANAAAVSRR
ncbi:tetratricopeptide repeat protein [Actinomycetospora sp. OC33-EN08]|uniref:Tetratricopeptide repeat protein n=1 Tax=Actinomycetospora aurantiaca TaxID=3129233 RepID=A0ABU8MVN4_9PSEU